PGSAPVRARVPPTPLDEMLLSTTLGSDDVEALESLTLGDVDEVLTDVDETVELVSVDVEEMDELDMSVDEVEVEVEVELEDTVPSAPGSAAGTWSFTAAWAEAPSPTKMIPVASRVAATLRDAQRIGGDSFIFSSG
ncbi:MAG: hypothetical protein ABW035_13585, partial [Acidimicrobiales bacterium]